jgi:hypothetical protein
VPVAAVPVRAAADVAADAPPPVRASEIVRRMSAEDTQNAELEALEAGWDELLA